MAAILDHFSDRLNAGAKSDLLALAKVTFIKSRTARVFYENGFKTVAAIANADPKELVPVLMQVRNNKNASRVKEGELTRLKGTTKQSKTQDEGRAEVRGKAPSQGESNCRLSEQAVAYAHDPTSVEAQRLTLIQKWR